MEKIWLPHYEAGIPAHINPDEFPSLNAMFAESVRHYRERTAFLCMGAKLSYGELDTLVQDFAAWLQDVLHLPRGERVAIMLPNVLQYPVCVLGALRGGYTVVNCNPLYKPRELQFQLADSGARVIVILENFAHTLTQIINETPVETVVIARLGDLLGYRRLPVDFVVKYLQRLIPAWNLPKAIGFRQAIVQGRKAVFRPVDVRSQDIAFLQYTGGTTGLAKGAMLTHRNLLANMHQAQAWVCPPLSTDGERVVTALPLYHIFAITANFFLFLRLGSSNLLIVNPRDIAGLIAQMAKYPFSVLTGVNTLFNALQKHPKFARLDFSKVKITLGGGAAIQKSVADRWQQTTGRPLLEAYGLTETSPAVCINPVSLKAHNGSIGLPLPSTEVAIRDELNRDLPCGERGELCVRGPQVTPGYYGQPEETAHVMTPDGFLRTGDIATIDERGFVYIVDRRKDMIIVSGFNVYPNEVEEVLAMHPGIAEAAAIGVPDAKTGEAVKAFIVRSDPTLSEQDISEHCRSYLSAYKQPRQIEFRDELPKTTVGKILRRALR